MISYCVAIIYLSQDNPVNMIYVSSLFIKQFYFTHLNTRKTNFKNWGTCKYFSPVVFGAVCKLVFIARSEFVEFNETMQIVFNAK